jgi:hypothetical protein
MVSPPAGRVPTPGLRLCRGDLFLLIKQGTQGETHATGTGLASRAAALAPGNVTGNRGHAAECHSAWQRTALHSTHMPASTVLTGCAARLWAAVFRAVPCPCWGVTDMAFPEP